jgi:hypothetical protein
MTIDTICEEIMSDWKLPMTDRVRLVRELKSKAKGTDDAKDAVRALAGAYMGVHWAKSTGANKAIGAYLGYLLSKRL